MSDQMHHGQFDPAELEKVELPTHPVILKSGGPIMSVVGIRHGLVVCEWSDGRAAFPPSSLYRLVEFIIPRDT